MRVLILIVLALFICFIIWYEFQVLQRNLQDFTYEDVVHLMEEKRDDQNTLLNCCAGLDGTFSVLASAIYKT